MSKVTRQPDEAQPKRRTIDKLHLVNFTAFKDLEIEFSPGINAIIGENATGKTHALKAMYVMTLPRGEEKFMSGVYAKYFLCSPVTKWNLIHKTQVNTEAIITIGINVSNYTINLKQLDFARMREVTEDDSSKSLVRQVGRDFNDITPELDTVFIPAKEMLSHSKGFVETYTERFLYFERQDVDILVKAGVAPLRNLDPIVLEICNKLELVMGGTIKNDEGVYYLQTAEWKLDMNFVAEGHRKFALLLLLLRNGSITPGTILFWDEPEANLNPKLIHETVQIILMMQRIGVQVFFATHDFVMLKWLDLLAQETDDVRFHALYRDETGDIKCESKDTLVGIQNNAILDVYAELYDKDLDRAMQRLRHGDTK